MGVAHFLTRLATSAPHVLVVEVGGDWLTRVTVEQAITRRGWPSVHSPADADVLAVCGPSGLSTTVDATIDAVWEQMPGPRARVQVPDLGRQAAEAALDRAVEILRDLDGQARDARARPHQTPSTPAPPDTETEHAGHDEHARRRLDPFPDQRPSRRHRPGHGHQDRRQQRGHRRPVPFSCPPSARSGDAPSGVRLPRVTPGTPGTEKGRAVP